MGKITHTDSGYPAKCKVRERVHGRFPGKAEGGSFGTQTRKEASSERTFQAEVALKVSGDSSNLTIDLGI